MDYEKLKAEIKEIAEISQALPETFREKCFEVLLNHLLSAAKGPAAASITTDTPLVPPLVSKPASGIQYPAAIKAFMRRNEVGQDQVDALLLVEGDELHFIKEPDHTNVAKGQGEWALLLALKNGIQKGTLTVDAESVRSVVQSKGFYDKANFAANFKKPKYAAFFKGPLESQGDAVSLSSDGEKELATLIKQLVPTAA